VYTEISKEKIDMNYLLLALCLLFVGLQSLFHKQYAVKSSDPISIYMLSLFARISAAAVMAVAIVIKGGFEFHLPTMIYAVFFGIGFFVATTALNICMVSGPMSLTNLIMSFSVILPTIYSVLFLGESFRLATGAGLVLLVISLIMFNYRNETLKFSKSWIFWVIILFISNGGCAVLQKIHQTNYPGKYQTEYLFVGMTLNAVVNLFIVIFYKDKTGLKNAVKYGFIYAIPQGIANIGSNLLIMMLNTMILATILYPAVAAAGIVFAFCWAVFIYKEKMTELQTAGFVTAVISIIVLNL
jgi:drug/metabolite transporter (DMT)-like permease